MNAASSAFLAVLVWASLPSAAEDKGQLTVLTGPEASKALRPPKGGHPLLVHVWASWCRPCVGEWPRLAQWMRRVSSRRVTFWTLAVDDADGLEAVRATLAPLGPLPGRTLAASLDDAFPAIHELDPEWDGSLPTTLLLDGEGRLVLAQHGITKTDALEEALRRLAPGDVIPAPTPLGSLTLEPRGVAGHTATTLP